MTTAEKTGLKFGIIAELILLICVSTFCLIFKPHWETFFLGMVAGSFIVNCFSSMVFFFAFLDNPTDNKFRNK